MIVLLLTLSVYFTQVPGNPPDEEIWYVWLDTIIQKDGSQVRIVGKQPFSITCCVKSGKYSRLDKTAQKWIRKNYDENFNSSNALKNIQDEKLALEIIKKANIASKSDDGILIVDYLDSCK